MATDEWSGSGAFLQILELNGLSQVACISTEVE
jgi:hypothetical protein